MVDVLKQETVQMPVMTFLKHYTTDKELPEEIYNCLSLEMSPYAGMFDTMHNNNKIISFCWLQLARAALLFFVLHIFIIAFFIFFRVVIHVICRYHEGSASTNTCPTD